MTSKYIIVLILFSIQNLVSAQSDEINSATNIREWYLQTGNNWYQGPKLFVKEFGSGKDTILMIHGGWGAEHSYLIDAVQPLSERFYFIFYDQRGSLRSPCPDSLISLQEHVQDIERLRKELNIKQWKILAHSMGTFLASAYLEEYPQHVNRMVLSGLVQPMSFTPEEDTAMVSLVRRDFSTFANRDQLNELLAEYAVNPEKTDLTSKERTVQGKLYFAAANIYNVDRWMLVKGGQGFFNQKAADATIASYSGTTWDYREAYRTSQVPITVINGEKDLPDCDVRLIGKWLAGIPNVEFLVLERAGHNAWIDRPERFSRLTLEALVNSR